MGEKSICEKRKAHYIPRYSALFPQSSEIEEVRAHHASTDQLTDQHPMQKFGHDSSYMG